MEKLVDMRMSAEEKMENSMPYSFDQREYPCGLSISLGENELEKLKVDADSFEIGDIIDLRAFAKVVSISENSTDKGECCRVELQIIMLGVEEEAEETAEPVKRRRR